MVEEFKEEKLQKEAAQNIGHKIKNCVTNKLFRIKTLLKENDMLNKLSTKLQYENESIAKLCEDRLLKEKEKQNKYMKMVVRKTKTQMKYVRKEKNRCIK